MRETLPSQGKFIARRLNIVGLRLGLDWRRMQEQEVGRGKEGGREGGGGGQLISPV